MVFGCAAGFVNVPKVKGTHTAVKSGIVAAETIISTFKQMELDPCDEENFEELSTPIDLSQYEENFKDSWAYRNCTQ